MNKVAGLDSVIFLYWEVWGEGGLKWASGKDLCLMGEVLGAKNARYMCGIKGEQKWIYSPKLSYYVWGQAYRPDSAPYIQDTEGGDQGIWTELDSWPLTVYKLLKAHPHKQTKF
jgi:hypothetical protein